MLYRLLHALDKIFGIPEVKAHCDIPCGIYDPIVAQIAALTVVRMLDLMADLEKNTSDRNMAYFNTLSRHIAVKEEHAEKVKHEVRVIWGDYLKQLHMEKYPETHALVHEIMALGSKVRQTTDREMAVKLVDKLNQFAQIFWETKGKTTKRAAAPYNPPLELIYPNL